MTSVNSLHLPRFMATLIFLTYSGNTFAQSLPATDIWLADIDNALPGVPARINISGGYNNQPHFSDDGSVIYYTREQAGIKSDVQTDIAAFHTVTMKTRMVSQTAESEYSPTPVPDRPAVSFIRVEPDQKQRLWAIDVENGDTEIIFPGIEPVGYHAWFNADEVAMFILGDVFTLQTARLGESGSKQIASNIGRSIRKHPQTGEILFVDKNREPWQIAAHDPATGRARSIMPLFPASEDFTIDNMGNYWTGNDAKLYKRSPTDRRWNLVADYSVRGIKNITRLAVNPQVNQIALVSEHVDSN